MRKEAGKVPDCRVCLVPHDEDIHSATLAVRQWFAAEVTKHFEADPEETEELTIPAA